MLRAIADLPVVTAPLEESEKESTFVQHKRTGKEDDGSRKTVREGVSSCSAVLMILVVCEIAVVTVPAMSTVHSANEIVYAMPPTMIAQFVASESDHPPLTSVEDNQPWKVTLVLENTMWAWYQQTDLSIVTDSVNLVTMTAHSREIANPKLFQ
eukprot:Rmarinus@m.4479